MDLIEDQVNPAIKMVLGLAKGATEEEWLWDAGRKFYAARNNPDGSSCGNRLLCYAEHYMLARWFVVWAGDINLSGRGNPGMTMDSVVPDFMSGRQLSYQLGCAAVVVYTGLKFLRELARRSPARSRDLAQKEKELGALGVCPTPNKPTQEEIWWGLKGCKDGLTPVQDGTAITISIPFVSDIEIREFRPRT